MCYTRRNGTDSKVLRREEGGTAGSRAVGEGDGVRAHHVSYFFMRPQETLVEGNRKIEAIIPPFIK